MHRRGRYRLFRPRYDWSMIRDQVGETAYGNAVSEKCFDFFSGLRYNEVYADHDTSSALIFIYVGLIYLQYLEIEVKNPRTHIENEKAQYTDYEIELKVRHDSFLLLEGSILRVSSALYLRSESSSISCTGIYW